MSIYRLTTNTKILEEKNNESFIYYYIPEIKPCKHFFAKFRIFLSIHPFFCPNPTLFSILGPIKPVLPLSNSPAPSIPAPQNGPEKALSAH